MSQSYKPSSTETQSTPGTSGLLTYTHYNGVDATNFKSTGTHIVKGYVSLTNPVSAIAGSSVLASSYDLDKTSYESVSSTGGLAKYLLDSPVAGARKTILVNPLGVGDVYIYASASSARTAYVGANTSGNIMSFTTPDMLFLNLVGLSTSQWAVSSLSTLNNGTTGTLSIASSNS